MAAPNSNLNISIPRSIDIVSSRVLSQRLRNLEEKGFIYRHYEPTIPPAVTYGLTERLEEMGHILDSLDDLAHKWQEEDHSRKPRPQKQSSASRQRRAG